MVLRWIGEWLTGRRQSVCINGDNSGWMPVTSAVPQGSVLGPALFLLFINDLDSEIVNWLLMFADDTNLFGKVNNEVGRDLLQRDLQRLVEWTSKWQMQFNISKCKVMHLGSGNGNYRYFMDSRELEVVTEDKDLGIQISNDLKPAKQCLLAYFKAIRALGMIRRTIIYKNQDILLRLYKTLVRPHLEYCVSAWSPYYIKDKELLDRVQHRFTRMVPGLRQLPYEQRLQRLGLWTLEER
jgi:ribonuclease P/MRP protein subunit RPP40